MSAENQNEQQTGGEPIVERPGARNVGDYMAPDAGEARRLEITRELIGGKLSPQDRAARMQELTRMTMAPDALAREDAKKAEVDAKVSANEKRRAEITKQLVSEKLDDKQRAALTAELKRLVIAETTPEQAAEWDKAPLSEKREVYGLEHPKQVPEAFAAQYEQEYGWAEAELITRARNDGLTRQTVHALRDAAVSLGMMVDGAPLSDDVVDMKLKSIPGLTDAQRAKYKALYREMEGGGGS